MRLQKQLKLFLSYFLQVSIVRRSVVIPWLQFCSEFFFFPLVIRAKKRYAKSAKQELEHLKTSSHVTANSIIEQCRTFKKLAFLRRLYQREPKNYPSHSVTCQSIETAGSFFCHFKTLRKMSLLTVCLLVQSAMLGFEVSVTHALTVSINLCKEWANFELRGIAFTEVTSQ